MLSNVCVMMQIYHYFYFLYLYVVPYMFYGTIKTAVLIPILVNELLGNSNIHMSSSVGVRRQLSLKGAFNSALL